VQLVMDAAYVGEYAIYTPSEMADYTNLGSLRPYDAAPESADRRGHGPDVQQSFRLAEFGKLEASARRMSADRAQS
jgi:hypothetical protein